MHFYMNMNKRRVNCIFSLMLLLVLFASCSKRYKIEGNSSVTSLDGKMLYLKTLTESGDWVTVDSAEVVHGLFKMKGQADSVRAVVLYMGDEGLMPLVLEDGHIHVDIANMQLEAGGMELPLRHISASAAHEQFPQYRLDAVRIGRRLYMDHPTKPTGQVSETATWRTWITNLRTLQAGAPLGYGGKVVLERDATVATIAVGYGDGLSEGLVQVHGPVLVGGERARLMACCMDQTLVDVTGIPCRVGDPVTLFGWDEQGNLLTSQEVALLVGDDEGCGLTSQLSPRVARIYSH